MIAIKLENNLACENICKHIQKAINRYNKENHHTKNDLYLVIKIQEAIDADVTPKLGFIDNE